jgi:hypothetical protein
VGDQEVAALEEFGEREVRLDVDVWGDRAKPGRVLVGAQSDGDVDRLGPPARPGSGSHLTVRIRCESGIPAQYSKGRGERRP